jgi:hypothetical protein
MCADTGKHHYSGTQDVAKKARWQHASRSLLLFLRKSWLMVRCLRLRMTSLALGGISVGHDPSSCAAFRG